MNEKNNRIYPNYQKLTNMLMNDQWAIEEIKTEIKNFPEINENESK